MIEVRGYLKIPGIPFFSSKNRGRTSFEISLDKETVYTKKMPINTKV
jgi:hypothetical protein